MSSRVPAFRAAFARTPEPNGTIATLNAGDFDQAVYDIRSDVDYKVLTEAVIQDPSTGEILYNLAQEDMVALRVTFRMGYAIPNPVTALDGTETRYPFAALIPNETI